MSEFTNINRQIFNSEVRKHLGVKQHLDGLSVEVVQIATGKYESYAVIIEQDGVKWFANPYDLSFTGDPMTMKPDDEDVDMLDYRIIPFNGRSLAECVDAIQEHLKP